MTQYPGPRFGSPMAHPMGPPPGGRLGGWQQPRKSMAKPIIASCIGVVVLLVVGIFVIVGTGGDEEKSAGNIPVASVSNESVSLQRPSVAKPTSSSADTSASEKSSTTKPSTQDKPQGPKSVSKLGDHPLFSPADASLSNLPCSLPNWATNPSAAAKFFTAARDCLDTVWSEALTGRNLPFQSPNLEFPSGQSYETPCGPKKISVKSAAFYCKGTLYLPFIGLQTDRYGNAPGVYLAVLAHEYGHHVQQLSGILPTSWDVRYDVGVDSAAGLEMSRRVELQAQCFSGLFLGSTVGRGGNVTRPMYDNAWDDQATRGDNTSGTTDHGSNEHYASWWRTGAKNNRLAQCNTFTASKGDVS